MFKKTKRRVQIVIMSVFVLIWMITLLIIYFSTAIKLQKENREMMQIYADAYATHGLPRDNFPGATVSGPGFSLPSSVSGSAMGDTGDFPQPPKGDGFISQREKEDLQEDLGHRYRLSTFYAVIFDREGQVKEYTNQQTSGLSDQELQDLSKQLLSSSSDYGSHENMVYLITYGNDYTMVTLMDISVLYAAIETLLGHMLIFGGIAIILILILSILLSNWVIGPIREAYEKQKVFISDAGHELKTPISTIDANLALLQRQEGQNQWLDNIKYENDRMSLMVHDLLDLARIEQAETLVQEVDFSHTALAAILPFEAIAFEEGHTLEYDIQDNLTLLGDPAQLEKLISILTDNALSHCAPGGTVSIQIKSQKGKILISVTNPGEEIPPALRDKIFDRFYRADQARAGDQNHYGLGLSIAKGIVENHRGKIWVECQEGQTTFSVQF